jgi:hypothetical protein
MLAVAMQRCDMLGMALPQDAWKRLAGKAWLYERGGADAVSGLRRRRYQVADRIVEFVWRRRMLRRIVFRLGEAVLHRAG